jgi:tetratricopeptide (TPR) repeat protein
MLRAQDSQSFTEATEPHNYAAIVGKSNSPTAAENTVKMNLLALNPATEQPLAGLLDCSPDYHVVEQPAPEIAANDLAMIYCEHGHDSIEAREYEQARSSYHIAVECDPQLAIAHIGLARAHYHLQDYEGALVACERAIQGDPSQTNFYYQRALIANALKNYAQVLTDCRLVLERTPHHQAARWLNAIALVKTEKYQVALFNLNQHIDFYPEDANAYCYRGICYDQLEKLNLAVADFDRAIKLKPNQATFYHARGRTRQRRGELQGALADFTLSIDLNPQVAAVYDDRAEVYRCRGDYLEALQDGDRAIELNPKFVDAYFRRGLTYAELGDLELALANYDQTIELDPQHVKAYIQRSWISFRQGNYKRAKQDCKDVKSFDQVCFCANYMLGIVNAFSGLKHNAIGNFSKSIEIFPYYVSARYHRGLMYYDLGDIALAMADFKQAREIQDQGLERLVDRDETGFYAEGLALYYLGQPEAARIVLTLGSLAAKRFNNPGFHKQILFHLEALGLTNEL